MLLYKMAKIVDAITHDCYQFKTCSCSVIKLEVSINHSLSVTRDLWSTTAPAVSLTVMNYILSNNVSVRKFIRNIFKANIDR